jgi:hypothetical protein
MVDFLDIIPKAHTEEFNLDTVNGTVRLELSGLDLTSLASIAKRFPTFARVIQGGSGSIIEASEAMPAVIAAGLGHPGAVDYEEKVAQLATADIMKMALTVTRLTFPAPPEEGGGERPLPPAAAAADPGAITASSPSGSSN